MCGTFWRGCAGPITRHRACRACAWPAWYLGRGAPPWPAELQTLIDWFRPHCERLHAGARVRLGQLHQLAALAASQPSRERFVTEQALDPVAAAGDESGVPHLDKDWLVLSTVHSAKGQEWNAVHALNVLDGCMPADMATGSAAEIEEERRLLYVAMTRARDSLTLWVPVRFHVTQQRTWGDRHIYAPMSRFITPEIAALFDPGPPTSPAQAALLGSRNDPASTPKEPPETEGFDLAGALRRPWA